VKVSKKKVKVKFNTDDGRTVTFGGVKTSIAPKKTKRVAVRCKADWSPEYRVLILSIKVELPRGPEKIEFYVKPPKKTE
jgi:hypothetical protein